MKQKADLALYSFLKIISEINCSADLHCYRRNKKLRQKIPGFDIDMGFGLHFGWAIEGAIGSEYKIDASYLSPNVNIASRLEAATKQYGVQLLVSDSFAKLLSTQVRVKLREIDRVTVKGSNEPLGLLTMDLNKELLPCRKQYPKNKSHLECISERVHYRRMIRKEQYAARVYAEDA